MIAGLEMPTSGRILIGGEDITERSAAERDVSMVFQSYALFPHLSVLENVRYGLVVSGTPKADANARARVALETVGLAAWTSGCLPSSRAASSSASPWPARWCSSPRCCSSTSRCRTSTPACGDRCARRSASCSSVSASPWCT